MPLNGAEPSTPSVGSHVHERARAHARRARAHAVDVHTQTQRDLASCQAARTRSSSAVRSLAAAFIFPEMPPRCRSWPTKSNCLLVGTQGERSQERRGRWDQRQRRRQGKIDACKRSRVYAFVYRTAYGGSMCRATKTRATS